MDPKIVTDTLWVLISAILIFFMGLGFACIESGFTRAKNCVNILSKNFIVVAIATFAFWVFGFGLMFGDGNPIFGLEGIMFLGGMDNSPATGDAYKGVYSALSWISIPLAGKFFFHMKFAMVAASIISGVVAERIKYSAFIVFSFLMVAFVYSVTGHWIWGNGWLAEKGMFDFAGSTVVHSVGGWAALSGVLLLGPRFGKYLNGSITTIPGHNMSLALIGVFAFWIGWFGFNVGSTMAANPELITHVALTTSMAASTAILGSTIASWSILKKPDLGMTINGCLGGLVAITASCAVVNVSSSAIIGFLAGWLVVASVMFFDRVVKIDDPVGALSVHLVNGVFGTLCVGFFAQERYLPERVGNGLFFGGGGSLLGTQFLGVWTVALYAFLLSGIFWLMLKYTIGIRVDSAEELAGLDVGEHGNIAYPDFVMERTGETFYSTFAPVRVTEITREELHRDVKAVPKGSATIQRIEAIIRPERLQFVRNALEKVGYPGIMVTQIEGHGIQKGVTQQWRGEKYKLDLLPKTKIEITVEKENVDKVVNAIIQSAKTGSFGDGKIFIYDTDGVIRIRTGEEGTTAIT